MYLHSVRCLLVLRVSVIHPPCCVQAQAGSEITATAAAAESGTNGDEFKQRLSHALELLQVEVMHCPGPITGYAAAQLQVFVST